MGGVISAARDIAKSVGKIAETVSNVAGKLMETLKKPVSELIAPIAKFIGDKVGKIPFFGQFLGPIVENLVKEGATALLGGGSLGALGFLAKLAPNIEGLRKLAETVKKVADEFGALTDNPAGLQNFQNIIAHSHASKLM